MKGTYSNLSFRFSLHFSIPDCYQIGNFCSLPDLFQVLECTNSPNTLKGSLQLLRLASADCIQAREEYRRREHYLNELSVEVKGGTKDCIRTPFPRSSSF